MDGPLVSVYGLRPEAVSYNESAEVLQHVWIAARTALREVFENVTIESLATRTLPNDVVEPHGRRRRLEAALSRRCWSPPWPFTAEFTVGRGRRPASVAWHDES